MSDNDALYVTYADGACRRNPGPMGMGALIINPGGTVIHKLSYAMPWGTNNQAEYLAAIAALEQARRLGVRRLELRMDSELVVRQLTGEYRVKNEGLQPLHERATRLLRTFERWRCVHVRRGENWRADKLANKALDQAESPPKNSDRPAGVVG